MKGTGCRVLGVGRGKPSRSWSFLRHPLPHTLPPVNEKAPCFQGAHESRFGLVSDAHDHGPRGAHNGDRVYELHAHRLSTTLWPGRLCWPRASFAGNRTRTGTGLPPGDFKSPASAISPPRPAGDYTPASVVGETVQTATGSVPLSKLPGYSFQLSVRSSTEIAQSVHLRGSLPES